VFNSDQGTQFTSHGDSVQEIRIENKSAMQYPNRGSTVQLCEIGCNLNYLQR
jgi:hypothetical protein